MRDNRGSVAQSVEQRTENPRVGGSNPSRTTTFQLYFSIPYPVYRFSPSKYVARQKVAHQVLKVCPYYFYLSFLCPEMGLEEEVDTGTPFFEPKPLLE